MSEKLLPCPFCGGDAAIVSPLGAGNIRAVECRNTECASTGPWGKNEAEAIDEWNTRAAMQADAAPVATSDRQDAIKAAQDVLAGYGNGTYEEALDAIRWLLQSAGIHDAPIVARVSTSSPVDVSETPETSGKLRDAVEVFRTALAVFHTSYPQSGEQAAAAVIEGYAEKREAAKDAELEHTRKDLTAAFNAMKARCEKIEDRAKERETAKDAEIEGLVQAWKIQHAEKMKERAEAKLWFEKAQQWWQEFAKYVANNDKNQGTPE